MKLLAKKIINFQPFRFVAVGVLNTILHFSVLNASFYLLNLGKVHSSILATIFAVSLSFFLNRDFVFKAATRAPLRQAVLFTIVTLVGMLFIHNGVYILALFVMDGYSEKIVNTILNMTGIRLGYDLVSINIATIFGAVAALFWNYNGYKHIVFHNRTAHEEK